MNNKKRNRKGFTIVELSIVIAVIAILAVAMIPVFGNIVGDSRKATAARNAQAMYSNYVNEFIGGEDGEYASSAKVAVKVGNDTYYVAIKNGGVVNNSAKKTTDYTEDEIKTHFGTDCYVSIAIDGKATEVLGSSCTAKGNCFNADAASHPKN